MAGIDPGLLRHRGRRVGSSFEFESALHGGGQNEQRKHRRVHRPHDAPDVVPRALLDNRRRLRAAGCGF
jgi:hypothetical protein